MLTQLRNRFIHSRVFWCLVWMVLFVAVALALPELGGAEVFASTPCPVQNTGNQTGRLLIKLNGINTTHLEYANWYYLQEKIKYHYQGIVDYSYNKDNALGQYSAVDSATHLSEHIDALKALIDTCHTQKGFNNIDLIGHSQGGVTAFYYLKEQYQTGGNQLSLIDHVVTLDSPVNGSREMCGLNTPLRPCFFISYAFLPVPPVPLTVAWLNNFVSAGGEDMANLYDPLSRPAANIALVNDIRNNAKTRVFTFTNWVDLLVHPEEAIIDGQFDQDHDSKLLGIPSLGNSFGHSSVFDSGNADTVAASINPFLDADVVQASGGGGGSPSATACPNSNETGWYCGGNGVSGAANTLYYCDNGNLSVAAQCGNGCQVNNQGTADACRATSASGACPDGDGIYCGSTLGAGFSADTLYQCNGGNSVAINACSTGCHVNPPGQADTCNPANPSTQLILYSQANNQGASTAFNTGATNAPDKTAYSLSMPAGWSVKLFDIDNSRGRTQCFNQSVADLSQVLPQGWHNAVDSIEVFSTNICVPEDSYVRLCRETGQTNCQDFTGDSADLGSFGFGNDTLKSMRVRGSWYAVLFEHNNYGGRKSLTDSDSNDLQNMSFGYGTSSVKVRMTEPWAFTLYRLGDYNDGNPFKSDRTLSNLDDWQFNDLAQSIRVAAGNEVVACSDAGFHGLCGRSKVDAGDINSVAFGLRNQVSSVQVCKTECPAAPAAPVLSGPLNQAQMVPGPDVAFGWAGSAEQYLIEVWGGDLASAQASGWINASNWSTNLAGSANAYSWHVKAWNPYGDSAWSETYTLTVRDVAPTAAYIWGTDAVELHTPQTFTAEVYPQDAGHLTFTWAPVPLLGQGTASAVYKWDVVADQTINVTVSNTGGSTQASLAMNVGCPGKFKAEYFGNTTLGGNPAYQKCEDQVNYDWGDKGPGLAVDGDLTVKVGETVYTDSVKTALAVSASAGQSTINVTSSAGFSAGDEVVILQMHGYGDVGPGNYEYQTIQSINANSIVLKSGLAKAYFTGGLSVAQILRVPRYQNVDVQAGGTLTAHAWDGSTGGVVAFKSFGTLNVAANGQVTVSQLGYRGAAQNNTGTQGLAGEDQHGPPGVGGMGGWGGCSSGYGDLAGGGGGGYATDGNSGGPGSGNGCNLGGRGGFAYGDANLNKILMGGGGGAGGAKTNEGPENYGGAGGVGGGIVMIFAQNIQLDGTVNATGSNGADVPGGRGGGRGGAGAGGSIKIERNNGTVDTAKLVTSGGLGGGVGIVTGSGSEKNGGNGSVGRTLVTGCSVMNCAQDNFSGRWTKQAYFTAGNYSFTTVSDDGVRLWVDGSVVVDNWTDHPPTTNTNTVTLSEGLHNVKLEYYERGGGAIIKLNWDKLVTAAAPTHNALFLINSGTLNGSAGLGQVSATVSTAGGVNYDGIVHNPLTYMASGLTGTYVSGGVTTFKAYVDALTSVANGTQLKISYDFNGDNTFDRTETYNYFPEDPVAGWEEYNQTKGIKSSTGAFANIQNGKVKVEIWNAIGSGTVQLRTNATQSEGNQSVLAIPFALTEANVAYQKAVTVDSIYSTYVASKAVDGLKDNANRWLSTNTNGPHWAEVDLAASYVISRAEVYSGWDTGSTTIDPIPNFVLQSWNGTAWIDIPGTSVSGNTNIHVSQTFTAVTTNKVRFYSTTNGYVRLKELELYGVPAVPVAQCNSISTFEQNITGWSNQTYGGSSATSVAQSTLHPAQGTYSIKLSYNHITAVNGRAGYDYIPATPLNLSSASSLKFNLWKTAQPVSVVLSVSTGSGWTWYESKSKALVDGDNAMTFSLTNAAEWNTPVPINLNDVKRISLLLFFNTNSVGEVYVDNVNSCN